MVRILQNKKKMTWLLGDMNFLFSCIIFNISLVCCAHLWNYFLNNSKRIFVSLHSCVISSIYTFVFNFPLRANEEFNNAVVLTSRCLGPNELFEVCVDQQVTKWAGSVEIGITTHDPETLEFPSTMTNMQLPGTWMMSGGSLVCDGVTVIEDYGPSLDEIKVQ